MERELYDNYLAILNSELIPALGCTEPIAIAFAAAKARDILGCMPESVEILCSGNIIKNVKGVTVPNSGGLKGIDVACVLGIVGGDAEKNLEVLQFITPEHIEKTKSLVKDSFCTCGLIENQENLYIIVRVKSDNQSASVEIRSYHTNITKITKNNEVIFSKEAVEQESNKIDKTKMNIKGILEFAENVNIEDIREVIGRQVSMNSKIANEGINNSYGVEVGRTILKYYDHTDIKIKAKAMAAAGSDARMGGCSLPVVINSGSGNQGLAVSLPVIVYAKELNVSEEKLFRALVLSNLISLHQKRYIGSLSAYCGATSAGCSAACGIAYLYGGGYKEISGTIINCIADIGGMICDGAKSSCAAKIASAVDAGIMGYNLSKDGHVFGYGEGLVESDVEKTIENIGRMGRVGMKSTDVEILNIMIGR